MKIADEAVEAAADAFDDTYEAQLKIGALHVSDREKAA